MNLYDIKIKRYRDSPNNLFFLWQKVTKEWLWQKELDEKQFVTAYFKNPLAKEIYCLVAEYKNGSIGTVIIQIMPFRKSGYIHLFVLPRFQNKGIENAILKKALTDLKGHRIAKKLIYIPIPFGPKYLAIFKRIGFKPNLDYPKGLLMKIILKRSPIIPNCEGYSIIRVEKVRGFSMLEQLANLDITYAEEGGIKAKTSEIIEEHKHFDKITKKYCYSIAIRKNMVLGYTRNEITKNVRGDLQLRNSGLIVKSDERNKGIGGALLKDGLCWGYKNSITEAYISTHSKNPARYLYENVGYKTIYTGELLEFNRF